MRGILPFSRPQSFIVYWPGEEQKLSWDGEHVTLPGAGIVVADDKLHRFASARRADGSFIPGSLTLTIIKGYNESKGEHFVAFDPQAWLEGAFGKEDGSSGPYSGMWNRGLRVVEDVGDITAEMEAECREAWEASQENTDQILIRQELKRRDRYIAAGGEAPPLRPESEAELIAAKRRLDERAEKKKRSAINSDDLRSTLSGRAATQSAPASTAAPTAELKGSVAALLDAAKRAGVEVSPEEIVDLASGDVAAQAALFDRIDKAMTGQPATKAATAR